MIKNEDELRIQVTKNRFMHYFNLTVYILCGVESLILGTIIYCKCCRKRKTAAGQNGKHQELEEYADTEELN